MPARPNVFVTRKIPESGLLLLKKETDVTLNPNDRALKRNEFLEYIKGRDGILTQLNDKMDAQVMEAAGKQLKVISNYAVGFDNIDVKEATKRGIVVTNTPGVLTEGTADFAWALLMSAARRVVEADALVRQGKFVGWDPLLLLGGNIYGKTLGIIGFGRIGQAVARRAYGFNMKILAYHPSRVIEAPGIAAKFVSLSELLKESDFITLHTPLTPETRHLIGEKELKSMKPTAYLINTARGPVIDEAALAKALKEKWIAGAGLDVYEKEPEVHPELLKLPNVVLAPHISSASFETRSDISLLAAKNLLAVLRGEPSLHRVN